MTNRRFASLVIVSVLLLGACDVVTPTPSETATSATGGQGEQATTEPATEAPPADAGAEAGTEATTAPADEPTTAPDAAATEVMTETTEVAPTGEVAETAEIAPTEGAEGEDAEATDRGTADDIPVVDTDVTLLRARTTVNIRTGPGLNYRVIGRLRTRQTAVVTGISENERWYQIECPRETDASCWVSADTRLVTAQ